MHKHNIGEGVSSEQDEGEGSWNVEATEVSLYKYIYLALTI